MVPVQLKRLIGQQKRRADALRRIVPGIRRIPRASLTVAQVNNALADLKGYWQEFYSTDLEISVIDSASTDPYLTEEVIQSVETDYRSARDELTVMLTELEGVTQSLPSASTATLDSEINKSETSKLPKLTEVSFSGKSEDWDAFNAYFTSTIHERANLSELDKFRYLLASLPDDVKRTIAHLPLKGDNYSIAWKELRDTYDKPRYQLNLLLDKLADLRPIKTLDAESLDSRVKAVHLTFLAMRKLTQSDTDLIEALMCHRLLQTLDMETRRLWEEQLAYRENQAGSLAIEAGGQTTAVSPYPKMVELVNWLNCRRDGLRSIRGCSSTDKSSNKTNLRGKVARAFHAASRSLSGKTKRRCALCSQEHYIGACPEFKRKDSKGRRDEARRLRLCFNCLGPHTFKNCKSTRHCETCKRNHHSLLHQDNVSATSTENSTPQTEKTQA